MPGARIQFKRATAASWTSSNPVLYAGEVGFETDTRKIKIGDGSTAWLNLQYAKPDIGELSIDNLQDVAITSASNGQVLKFNGQQWVNATDSTGTTISSIDDINDVTITSATNGQVLKFNGTSWVNAADSTGTTISSIDDINDVAITSASEGQVLKYNGSSWINSSEDSIDINSITDVVITAASSGQVLQYDGSNWINAEPTGGTATLAIHPFAMLG